MEVSRNSYTPESLGSETKALDVLIATNILLFRTCQLMKKGNIDINSYLHIEIYL